MAISLGYRLGYYRLSSLKGNRLKKEREREREKES